ncbi:MAG: phosphoadenylyl-sulfate reductase [Gammaproteobacteria bacterium]|nr:phosphoadenylyl-sulfate reductase [Gammaproteobacteria bacterium]
MTLDDHIEQTGKLLRTIATEHAPATFANSLGAEDMVLADLICTHAPGISQFTLDTGRLPEETYQLIQRVRTRYKLPLRVYFPQPEAVQEFVSSHGPNAFYESVALRKHCCHIRKIEPLRRALAGHQAWITGLRRTQSTTRADTALQEWDADNRLQKFNPLIEWSEQDVWDYIRRFDVPYNTLHDKGYPSIGCAPCTRAITKGEDIRAGRWWWEHEDLKECGLHPQKSSGNTH